MKTPRAGRLRHQVVYQEKTAGTASEFGDATERWYDVAEPWAEVISLSGGELFRASQVHIEASVQVTVRYDSRITAAGRFVYQNRHIYPLSVSNDFYNRFLICLCKERVGETV